MKNKKRLAILLTLSMIISLIPLSVFATESHEFFDMPDNWAKAALQNAVSNELIIGDNGKIRPDDNLTRAQMAAVINRAFGSLEKASLKNFNDVLVSSWYYEDMGKAIKMRTFIGSDDGLLQPERNITREEAFTVLARAFKVPHGSASVLDVFSDKDSVSAWAMEDVAYLVVSGYISGSDGKLNPKKNITRAEFAQLMDNLIKQYIKASGTYTEIVSGNVMINVPGVTLKDVEVKGDLIIGDGVGEGNVTLDNVDISGRMIVRGGGINSIIIKGDSKINKIIVARVDGKVRIYSEDGTEIGTVIIDGLDDVIIEGDFESINISADNVTVTALNANIKNALIEGDNSFLIVSENSSVESVTVRGSGIKIQGEGEVDEVLVYGDNVSVKTLNTSVTAASGSSNVMAADREVTTGNTVITRPKTTSSRSSEPIASKAATPTANPIAGEVENGATVVLTTTTTGAAIYYTLDGSIPTSENTEYSEPITISEDTIIKAIAVKVGMNNSNVLTAEYTTVTLKAATPTANPIAGEVESGTAVILTTTTTGAAIYYTLDGSAPTSENTEYSEPITISQDTIIKAIAVKAGLNNSNVLAAAYTIETTVTSDFAGGFGTEASPYQIGTAEQLDKVRNYLDAYFIQIADINLTNYLAENGASYNEGEGWNPIGEFSLDKRFTGSYDGDSFVINNLTINRDEMYQGLFGYVSNATIKNVNLENVNITGSTWTAGLVAFQDGGQIINSSSKGTVKGLGNHGGLVAQSNGATYSALIKDCHTEGEVITLESTGTPNYTGGLVGRTNESVISRCYSSASVSGVNTVGGLVGLLFNSTIEESYATGNILGTNVMGGIAGQATGNIRDIYYYGTIGIDNIINVEVIIGGIVGKYSDLNLENGYCIAEKNEYNEYYPYYSYYGYYDPSISASNIYTASTYDNDNAYAGFYERTIDNLKKLYTFKNLDFQNIWGHNIAENNSHPFLRWQGHDHIADFAGGTGTETYPYKVATANQLDNVRDYPDAYFIQTANIDLTDYLSESGAGYNSGEGWEPIGTSTNPFTGSYDGDDFTITNLWINRPNANYQGLFGYVQESANLSNIHLIETEIYACDFIGALAGYSIAEITGCTAVSVDISCEDMYAGGLVGQNSGSIIDCSTTGMVKADYEYAGGLVGYNYGNISSGYDAYIQNSWSEAEVTYLNSDEYELEGAGGLVGYNDSGSIEDCYSTGSVTGHEAVGGLIGENWRGTVLGCYATGNVSGISDCEGYIGYYAGGLIGENTYLSNVINCYAEGNISGQKEAGGLIGYNSATIQKCYAVGNVTGIEEVGGLVGDSSGTIENTYATGSATGTHYVGGLVGYLEYTFGTITNSYAAGSVNTASSDRGGLHGGSIRLDSVFNCYYDMNTTGQSDTGKGELLTTVEMTDQSSYSGWDFTDGTGIWSIQDNPISYPYLQWQTENIPLVPMD